MEYNLNISQNTIHVNVDIREDRSLQAVVNQKIYDVSYNQISENQIHVKLNCNGYKKQVNAYVADMPDGKIIFINGRQYLVRDLEAQGKRVQKTKGLDIPNQITPPMPSVVVKILVQIGDRVEKGQSVIVVSAMKMETTLCAPFNGTVAQINAAINDKVAPGQILVEIEKAEGRYAED